MLPKHTVQTHTKPHLPPHPQHDPQHHLQHLQVDWQAHPAQLISGSARAGVCALVLAGALLAATLHVKADVLVEGIDATLAGPVRAGLSLRSDCTQPRWQIRHRFREAEGEIKGILETFGYYTPSVEPGLDFTAECFNARFLVNTGPPTLIREADVTLSGSGAELDVFRDLVDNSTVRQGARFDHRLYEAYKTTFEDVAARYGFLDARFTTQQVVVNVQEFTADIELRYDTGPRHGFGNVTYDTDAIEHRLLARYLPFESGDPYDADLLIEFYQSLTGSGYFEDVSVQPMDPVDAVIPIQVNLTPGKSRQSRVGLGISTDIGPNLTLGQTNRLVNQRGHQMSLDANWAPVQSELGGYYRVPQPDISNGWYSLYGGFQREDTETSKTSSTSIGIRKLTPRGNQWVQTLFLELNNDHFEVARETQDRFYAVPGVNLSYTKTDRTVARPGRAHHIGFELSGADEALGSAISFISAELQARLVHSLTPRIRFLGRFRVGLIHTHDFGRLPPRVRFFSGGDSRVRGYDYETIGVTDALGNVIGGDRLIEYSTELDLAFKPKWAAALFFDAGNVSLGSYEGDFSRAVGIGLRWYSPIGPLRLDLARPIGAEISGVRLHVSLGPDV